MSKEYHRVGSVFGQPVLVEVDSEDAYTKAILYDYIKSGHMPEWVAADPNPQAVLFEETYPLFKMPKLDHIQEESK